MFSAPGKSPSVCLRCMAALFVYNADAENYKQSGMYLLAAELARMLQDNTETNLINLRRTIYLTIMSGLTFEETGHKLMKIELAPRQEFEVASMILECCSQEKTFSKCAPAASISVP